MINLLKKDTLMSGVLLGLLSFLICCGILYVYSILSMNFSDYIVYLKHPRIECLLLIINVILFRFMIVKWDRLEIAKGFFLILFLSFLVFIYATKYHLINLI